MSESPVIERMRAEEKIATAKAAKLSIQIRIAQRLEANKNDEEHVKLQDIEIKKGEDRLAELEK